MNRIFLSAFTFFLVAWYTGLSQPKSKSIDFISPLSDVFGITGSFGEIRSDHFHSGIDLSTNGSIGKEIKATNSGYISRIKVSANGYGKSIFIDHQNGLTTGYGHLDRYADQIEDYIKRTQYQLKSFEIDVFPKPSEFPINKGDLVAFSGNSGGSSGPHLHYEVRTTIDQQIVSPAPEYLTFTDSIAPIIRSLHIYTIDSASYSNSYSDKKEIPISKHKNDYTVIRTVNAYKKIGIGIDVMDRINNLNSQLGFRNISLSVNGKIIYKLEMQKFAFAETRYVNSIIDYAAKYTTGKEIVKLFAEKANFFSGIHNLQNRGIINVQPDSLYRIQILIGDANSNITKLDFSIKGVKPTLKDKSTIKPNGNTTLLSCMIENSIVNDTFILQIPKYSLYDNLYFYHRSSFSALYYSPIVKLHSPKTPIHIKAKLSIKSMNLPIKYQSKSLLATFDKDKKISAAGGEWKDGMVTGNISGFGDYVIVLDTIAPEITPLNIRDGADLTEALDMRLLIKDDLSGIAKIDGYIDNKWVVFDYDKKNNLISYKFDKERLKKGIEHSIEIVVLDIKNNEGRFHCKFRW